MLCSVVKHLGSGRARKKCRGKHETQSSVSHFLSALPLPKCFTTEQNTVEASIFVNSADLGGCYPPRSSASVDNTLLDR